MYIDPWEDGPHTPFWATDYFRTEDDQRLRYEFKSHADTMAQHLEHYNQGKPEDAQRLNTRMVFTRAGHLVG